MENKEQNKAELILSLAHNLLNAVEELQKENELLSGACDDWRNLNRDSEMEIKILKQENAELQAELATTQMELKKAKDTLNNEPNFGWCWYSVLEATPLDGEQVLVRTDNGTLYLKTYTPECGWRAEEEAWMSIPECKM